LQLFHDIAYISLFAVVLLSFAVAYIMNFIGIGEHPLLAAIAGSAIGILFLFIFPTAIVAAGIVAGIATIGSNLVLSRLLEKLGDTMEDKFGAKVDAKIAASNTKARNRDYEKILFDPDAKERVKFLKRYFRNNGHYFWSTAVAAERIYRVSLEKIESFGIKTAYPDMEINQVEAPEKYVIQFWFQESGIALLLKQADGKTDILLGFGKYNDDALKKFQERVQFEDRMAIIIDRLYLLFGHMMRELDPNIAVIFKG
jgi:hypothetical protein